MPDSLTTTSIFRALICLKAYAARVLSIYTVKMQKTSQNLSQAAPAERIQGNPENAQGVLIQKHMFCRRYQITDTDCTRTS